MILTIANHYGGIHQTEFMMMKCSEFMGGALWCPSFQTFFFDLLWTTLVSGGRHGFRVATAIWVTSEYFWKNEWHLSHSILEKLENKNRVSKKGNLRRFTISSLFPQDSLVLFPSLPSPNIQDRWYQETRRGWCSTLGRLWSKEGAMV